MRRYILGFFTAAAAAAALWLLHRTFPCPLTALLAPANGSPWEMGKLLFWPYLPAALVIWRLGPEEGLPGRALPAAGGDAPVHGGAVLAAAGPVAAAVEPGAGRGTDPPRHGAVRRVPGGELVWYVLAILVGIAYLLLTVGAPDIGPFADPAAAAMGTIPF